MSGYKTVLIVEDDEVIREILEQLLQYQGYSVVTANHGKDVLEKLCTTRPANETAREPLDRLESNMPIPEESGPVS